MTYLTAKQVVLCVLSVAGSVAVAVGEVVFAVGGVDRHIVWIGRSWALAKWVIARAISRAGSSAGTLLSVASEMQQGVIWGKCG